MSGIKGRLTLPGRRIASLVTLLLALPVAASTLGAPGAAGEVLEVGNDKQLFLGPWTDDGRDGHLVASMRNVTIAMHQARVTGERFLEMDRPWEMGPDLQTSCRIGVMLREGDRWRAYYQAFPKYPKGFQEPHSSVICYAESPDGLHWEKPQLGRMTWNGSRANNIVLPSDDFPFEISMVAIKSLFRDPRATSPRERYKMTVKLSPVQGPKRGRTGLDPLPNGKGKYGFVSPDGLSWRLATGRLGTSGDGDFAVSWDENAGLYVGYSRVKHFDDPRQLRYFRERYGNRELDWRARVLRIARSTSPNFVDWTEETIIIAPDEMDEVDSAPNRVDFYGAEVFRYLEAPRAYVALLPVYGHWNAAVREDGKLAQRPGRIDVQLATSRDGIHWSRTPLRRPFIPLGPQGSFWSGMILPHAQAFPVGDELWIYFNGFDAIHGTRHYTGAVGRAVLRLDGFLSARASYTGGELTTKRLKFSGSTLQLNLETGAGGSVQVEIQDEKGLPIPGFTAAEADEINGNHVRIMASWQGSRDLRSLEGRTVRLRFVMRDANLYSFRFLARKEP